MWYIIAVVSLCLSGCASETAKEPYPIKPEPGLFSGDKGSIDLAF